MKYYAVIDTNVFLSALLSKREDAATVRVLRAVFSGRITPLYHQKILNEYKDVFQRDKFNLPEGIVKSLQDVIINDQKIEIKIWNTTTEPVESYMASFEYQDVLYFISAQLPFEEMKQMVRLMYLY